MRRREEALRLLDLRLRRRAHACPRRAWRCRWDCRAGAGGRTVCSRHDHRPSVAAPSVLSSGAERLDCVARARGDLATEHEYPAIRNGSGSAVAGKL